MSLKALPIPPVPEDTARVAHAAFPRGNMFMQVRDTLGTTYTEQRLLDLLLEQGREEGWVKAHGRQRTDSTHILAKIRSLSRTDAVSLRRWSTC